MDLTQQSAGRGEAGFSLVEALIATALLGAIAIGVLPLFTQAIVNSKQGSDSTEVTTFGRSNVETLLQVPWDAATVTIPPGSNSLVTTEWYVQQSSSQEGGTNGQWVASPPGPAGPGVAFWKRTTTVQQFSVNDVTFSNPLPGLTSPDFVHLKRIQVVVQRVLPTGQPLGPLQAGKTITLQILRAD